MGHRPRDRLHGAVRRGKSTPFLGSAEPLEMRARKTGRVILNSTDKPWSQYFCCMLAGNADFVREHPVATKRALRAVLKANDLCASDPQGVSRGSSIGVHAALRLCPPDADRASLRKLARVRSRTRCGSMRCGCTRSASSPRAPIRSSRRHRLALRQRAQARAEGVSQRHANPIGEASECCRPSPLFLLG